MTKKIFGIAFMAIVLCIGFSSCSDDDKVDVDHLVGTWEFTEVTGWYKETINGKETREDMKYGRGTLTFNENKTGFARWYEDDELIEDTFTWSFNTDTDVLNFMGEEVLGFFEKPSVIKLTSSTLTMEETFRNTSSGNVYEYYGRVTLKKK